jgi:spore coat protein JB
VNEREVLLKRVQVCDFALVDAALFLDTHPENQMALDFYKKHLEMRKAAADAYTSKFGPLVHSDYDGGPYWNWVEGPWPWQHQEEA